MLRDHLVQLNVLEVADDVQDVVEIVVENGLVREKADLDDCGCRQDGSLDVEVEDIVDVLEIDNVEHDAVEETDMLYSMVVDVEALEDNVEVVDIAQYKVDEVDDVQDEIVSGKRVEKKRHEKDVKVEMPNAG